MKEETEFLLRAKNVCPDCEKLYITCTENGDARCKIFRKALCCPVFGGELKYTERLHWLWKIKK